MLIDETEGVDTTETEVVEEVELEEETPEVTEVKDEKKSETLEQREARLERQLAQTRKKLGREVEPTVERKETKSGGLDYGQKAYLLAQGIKDAKEVEFVQKEMKESGLELDALLENGYFKEKFSQFQGLNKTADAIPKGRRGSGAPTDSVEYWATKPIEEVPNDMRIKVVNYRLAKEKNGGIFYNS